MRCGCFSIVDSIINNNTNTTAGDRPIDTRPISWFPLGFHPALRGAGLGSTLVKMSRDPMCVYLYKAIFHDASPSKQIHPCIRIAWKNALPNLTKLVCNHHKAPLSEPNGA